MSQQKDHVGNTNKMITAVEWLENKLPSLFLDYQNGFYKKLFEQAKAMEKKQIIDAYEDAYMSGYRDNGNDGINYYNQTFKSE